MPIIDEPGVQNAYASLQLNSTTKGALFNRLTTAERTALGGLLGSGDAGMTLFDTDLVAFYNWDGSAWAAVGSGSIPGSLTSLTLTGTAGSGFVQMRAQASDPSAPGTDGFVLFPNASSYLAWRVKNGSDTYTRQFIGVLTAARSYTLPDYNGTLATLAGVESLTNKTYAGKTLALSGATDPTSPIVTLAAVTLAAATISNKELTTNVATLTTSAAHGFSAGWTVFISGVDDVFDGQYVITGVTSNTFSYALTHADVASAAASGTAKLVQTLFTVADPTSSVKAALNSRGHLSLAATAPSAVAVLNLGETVADPQTTVFGILNNQTVTLSENSAVSPLATGFQNAAILNQGAYNATSGAPGALRGLYAVAQVAGASGTVTAGSAAVAQLQVVGGGTLTTGYGVYVLGALVSGSTLTNQVAIVVPASSAATNNTKLLLGTATPPAGNWDVYVVSANNNSIAGKLALGRNATPLATLDAQVSDSGTTTVIETAAFVRNSSGTPAAGLGGDVGYYLKSSTTADTLAARLRWYWSTATHASRKAYSVWSAYDTAERDAIGIGANGSAPLLGFYNLATAPIAQQVLATGASHTVDDVITALQALGLVKQS